MLRRKVPEATGSASVQTSAGSSVQARPRGCGAWRGGCPQAGTGQPLPESLGAAGGSGDPGILCSGLFLPPRPAQPPASTQPRCPWAARCPDRGHAAGRGAALGHTGWGTPVSAKRTCRPRRTTASGQTFRHCPQRHTNMDALGQRSFSLHPAPKQYPRLTEQSLGVCRCLTTGLEGQHKPRGLDSGFKVQSLSPGERNPGRFPTLPGPQQSLGG